MAITLGLLAVLCACLAKATTVGAVASNSSDEPQPISVNSIAINDEREGWEQAETYRPTELITTYLPYIANDWPPSLEILIPLYRYPFWWAPDQYIWDDVAAANSQVSITAIINPDSGPGGCPPNTDYQRGLNDLREAGVTILGYVYTSWCGRDKGIIKGEVNLYDQCFDIDGIFFDEVEGGSCSHEDCCDYYRDLCSYVKQRPNLELVFLNPGTKTDECYYEIPTCDTINLHENSGTAWPDYQPCPYVVTYPSEKSSMLVHSEPDTDTMKSHIDLAVSRNVGYVYVTDDLYNDLPSYWQAEIDYIMSLNRGITTD
jgi:hypothetical protein